MADKTFRDKIVEFLAAQTDERDEMLALLTNDERRAYMYQCYQVPALGRIDPNRLPEPPFPDRKMRQLLDSTQEKILFWMVERIAADRPTTLVDIANQSPKSN